MKSPQGHRYRVLKSHRLWGPKQLRPGRHRIVSIPAIYAEDARLVPGLECWVLTVCTVGMVSGIKHCARLVFLEEMILGSRHLRANCPNRERI